MRLEATTTWPRRVELCYIYYKGYKLFMTGMFSRQAGALGVPRRVSLDRLSHVLFLVLACALIRAQAADYYLQTSDEKIGLTPDIIGLGACFHSIRAFCSSTTRSLASLFRGLPGDPSVQLAY